MHSVSFVDPPISRPARVRLAALAVGGTLAYQAALMLPIALVLTINVLWFNVVYAYWLAAALLVFFWWTFQPRWNVPGELVSRHARRRHRFIARTNRAQLISW